VSANCFGDHFTRAGLIAHVADHVALDFAVRAADRDKQ
jgi:hypothetical protein